MFTGYLPALLALGILLSAGLLQPANPPAVAPLDYRGIVSKADLIYDEFVLCISRLALTNLDQASASLGLWRAGQSHHWVVDRSGVWVDFGTPQERVLSVSRGTTPPPITSELNAGRFIDEVSTVARSCAGTPP